MRSGRVILLSGQTPSVSKDRSKVSLEGTWGEVVGVVGVGSRRTSSTTGYTMLPTWL